MNVAELIRITGATLLNDLVATDGSVTGGYTCDLLSWVMSHGKPGMAWITVQTHMNVVAVASLLELCCIIIPEGIRVEQEVLEKATQEGIPVLSSAHSAFHLCGLMSAAGITAG